MADGGAVFTDSPLHRYLAELAADDTGSFVTDGYHARLSPSVSSSHETQTVSEGDRATPLQARDCDEEKRASDEEKRAKAELAAAVLHSPLLLEDDALLLHALDPSLFSLGATQLTTAAEDLKQEDDAKKNAQEDHVARKSRYVWLVAGALTAASALVALLRVPSLANTGRTSLVFTAAAMVAFTVRSSPALAPSRSQIGQHRRLQKAFKGESARACLRELEALAVACGKGIRAVQEAELVARGFRLAIRLPPVVHMESGGKGTTSLQERERSCLALRQAVDLSLRLQLDNIRQLTVALRQTHPVAHAWDGGGRLHADCPLSDFGRR
jgi:hypothetical protein